MKQFAATLLFASAMAVKVKTGDDYEFDEYTVVPDSEYVTGVVEEPARLYAPPPRYWDNHLHYKGPTQVDFTRPKRFVAPKVNYRTSRYVPYIPKFKNNYVDVVKKDSYSDFGELFKPYNFYEPPTEEIYGDPIYDPKNDKLHGKPPKKEKEADIHGHGAEEEAEMGEHTRRGHVVAATSNKGKASHFILYPELAKDFEDDPMFVKTDSP